MLTRIKTFFRRLRGFNFNRLWMLVSETAEESGRNKLALLIDMIWCAVYYGTGYLDYRVFGFAWIRSRDKRKTFMTMNHNLQLVRNVNDKAYDSIFTDKARFNARFAEFIGRQWLDLRSSDYPEFEAFIRDKKFIFAKVTDGFGGVGVERLCVSQYDNKKDLYDSLLEKRQFIIEERIPQHPEMDRLCPTSINTLRVTTVLAKGEAHVMYALVRMGNGTKAVDNISSGGMYCRVGEDGVIHVPAFCDKTGKCYETHPSTGTKLIGFAIPYFKEALEMVKRAAHVVPQIRYVGWDVAITPDGPVLVEGNTIPGYDMCQNYYHLGEKHEGILPRFRAIFGEDLSDFS